MVGFMGGLKGLDLVKHMQVTEPEHYHSMVKMHLSFMLDLHTDECDCSFLYEKQDKESKVKKAFTPMKKKATRGVMDGVPLTQEGVCQVYQIIEYLGRNHNITSEGLFRKHGNLKKQQALKERLNKGIPLNLDDDEFSVHECAAVLKTFLANLPEPLLTDAYYRAHCQVPLLCRDDMDEEDKRLGFEKQIACLQLLFQLIPVVNFNLLKDLLCFLHGVSQRENENKMSAANLGTVFATHIMCPRKLAPEILQSNHQLLTKAVTFMIEHADQLFMLPDKLILDVESYLARKAGPMETPKGKVRKPVPIPAFKADSPVVNTVFSFVDREASRPANNATDEALAALYAHVQSMPESAQKRRLVSKLNEANGKGTPDVATSGSVRTVGRRHHHRRSGDPSGLINLLTPRRKRPAAAHGSYSLRKPPQTAVELGHSFRRQNSLHPEPSQPGVSRKGLSPNQSSPALLSPATGLRTAATPLARRDQAMEGLSKLAGSCSSTSSTSSCWPPVDEVDTPGKSSDSGEDCVRSTGEHDGSFCAPPLPPRTPAPQLPLPPRTPASQMLPPSSSTDRSALARRHSPSCQLADLSPLTQASASLPRKMRMEAMTPRSRAPVIVCSSSQLDKWDRLIPRSPSVSRDEPTSQEISVDEEKEEKEEEILAEKDKAACRTRSLSSEFKQYLAQQGLQVPSDTSSLEDSTCSETSCELSYSEDVRRLLRGGEVMSPSMQVALDGEDPETSKSTTAASCTEPDDISRCSSSASSTATLKLTDTSTDQESACGGGGGGDENADPNPRRRGRKRRSLTEAHPAKNPLVAANHPPANNIFFETDL